MKKILLIDDDLIFIGDLNSRLARRCDLLVTGSFKTAWQLLKTIPVDLLLIRLSQDFELNSSKQLQKFLKKLNNSKYEKLTKILIISKGGDFHADDFSKMGIAAVVFDVREVERWVR